MAFEGRYPDEAGSTYSFLPGVSSILNGAGGTQNMGFGVQTAADQLTSYSYRFSGKWKELEIPLKIPVDIFEDLVDFLDGVNGDAFFVKDTNGGSCGRILNFLKVKLTDEGQKLPMEPVAGGLIYTVLKVRESN